MYQEQVAAMSEFSALRGTWTMPWSAFLHVSLVEAPNFQIQLEFVPVVNLRLLIL
jgi:hypothetical protein